MFVIIEEGHKMFYYKNVIDDEICGLTTTNYKLDVEHFYEISEEEYIMLGGISKKSYYENSDSFEKDPLTESLLDAFIE